MSILYISYITFKKVPTKRTKQERGSFLNGLFGGSWIVIIGPQGGEEGVELYEFRRTKEEFSLNRPHDKDHGAPEGMRSDLDQEVSFPEIQNASKGTGHKSSQGNPLGLLLSLTAG